MLDNFNLTNIVGINNTPFLLGIDTGNFNVTMLDHKKNALVFYLEEVPYVARMLLSIHHAQLDMAHLEQELDAVNNNAPNKHSSIDHENLNTDEANLIYNDIEKLMAHLQDECSTYAVRTITVEADKSKAKAPLRIVDKEDGERHIIPFECVTEVATTLLNAYLQAKQLESAYKAKTTPDS